MPIVDAIPLALKGPLVNLEGATTNPSMPAPAPAAFRHDKSITTAEGYPSTDEAAVPTFPVSKRRAVTLPCLNVSSRVMWDFFNTTSNNIDTGGVMINIVHLQNWLFYTVRQGSCRKVSKDAPDHLIRVSMLWLYVDWIIERSRPHPAPLLLEDQTPTIVTEDTVRQAEDTMDPVEQLNESKGWDL